MARKPRIEFAGALYHVLVRGNHKQNVFKGRFDFLKYLEVLFNYKKRYHACIFSYVLMSNHVHLLIETQETPLSKIMQGINQSYTVYFNRKYGTVGHLFQGRYKAILCDRDAYLLSLLKYIHLNPARAHLVENPKDYEWSSHRAYARKEEDTGLAETEQVLRIFSKDKGEARSIYRSYMKDTVSMKKEDVYRTADQRILGEEAFVEKVMDIYEGELSKEKREREYSLTEIIGAVERICDITIQQIRDKGKSQEVRKGRYLVSLIANEYGYRGKEIAKFMCKDASVISRHLREKSNMKEDMETVLRLLTNKKLNNQV